MKMLDISVGTMVMRLHLMCAVMVTLGFAGFLYLGIILGMVIFLSTLMGIQFKHLNPFKHLPTVRHYDWERQHRHAH